MGTRAKGKLSSKIGAYTCEPGERKVLPDGMNGLYLFVDWRNHNATEPRRVFVFDARLRGRTQQQRIGDFPTWTLTQARERARELKALVDKGTAPAAVVARKRAEDAREAAQREAQRVTLLDAWRAYVDDRQASPKPLSDLSLRDYARHIGDRSAKVASKGAARKSGSLQDWQALPLVSIDREKIKTRYAKLVRERGSAQASQVMRQLRAVMNFAARDPQFKEALPNGNPVLVLTEENRWADVAERSRVLERSQLPEWWRATQQLDSPTVRDYLRFLLLTGARRGEALALRWENVDFRWRSVTFSDTKTGGDRVIPMTRYVEGVLIGLRDRAAAEQRRAEARAAKRGVEPEPGARDGYVFDMVEPAKGIQRVADATGVYLSSHDMRRSFSTLSEWCEIPSGIIRQTMGHSSKGDVHERHYRRRPLDLLAMHLQRYEDWLLTEAGEAGVPVETDRLVDCAPSLRVVA